jgi:hypothetical protein
MEKLKILYSKIFVLVQEINVLAQEMIFNPRAFWKSRNEIRETQDDLFKNLLFPLLAAVCTAVFFGEFFRSDYFRIWVALLWVIREILLFAALYFVGVYGTNEMIKYFGYEEKTEPLQKLVAYSMVPFMLVSVVTGLFPFFYFLDIFGIYGFYIFTIGSNRLLSFPKEKRGNIILKIVAANWIVFGLLSFVLARLLMPLDQGHIKHQISALKTAR